MFTTLGAAFLTTGAKLAPSLASRLTGAVSTLVAGSVSPAQEVSKNKLAMTSAPAMPERNPNNDL
jgi:hypothetical protein